MKMFTIINLMIVFLFTLGAYGMLHGAILPEQIDPQTSDTNVNQEISDDQVNRKPVTTEYINTGGSSNTQQSASTVEDVKGLITGFVSAGTDLSNIVSTLKKSGFSSNDIALGLISLGYGDVAYNLIAEVFSKEEAAKVVPAALVNNQKEVMADNSALENAGVSYEDMTKSLIAKGYSYTEIVTALKKSGASAQEVLLILQNAGYEDRQIVTMMLDGNYTTSDIVKGMIAQGMSTDQIFKSFKNVDTGIVRKAAEVVAALVKSGISTDDVISAAKGAGISIKNIVAGLSAGGLSIEEVFSVMEEQGVSESKVVGYLLDGGTNTNDLVNAMIAMGKSAEEIFNAFKTEGNSKGELLCVALINSKKFTIEEVVSAASKAGISWDKISLGLKNSGSTISEIIEILQSNGLTEKKIVDALRKNTNFGAGSMVIAMNELGWSMETIIASFDGAKDDAAVVTGLIKAGYSAEEVITAVRKAGTSWENITKGLVSTGMSSEEVYTILSEQGLSDIEVVGKMLDSGRDAGGIVAGLINLGMDMNSIFKAFKNKIVVNVKVGKSVVSALMKSGKYTFEEIAAAAKEAGMKVKDIAKGMEFGNADFDKIVQYLKDNGLSDKEVVSAMMDKGGGNIGKMVQGMVTLGWDSARIFEAFKEESVTTTSTDGETETETVTESNVVRQGAAVVAALVKAGVSVDEVVTAAIEAKIDWDPITQGLQQGGVSAADTFTVLTSNGLSNSKIVTSMLAGGYNAGDIATAMLNQGSDMNQVIDAFTSKGKPSHAAELVDAFLKAGFETDAVVSTVQEAGASWKEIASGLKTNGFESLEVLTILTNNNLSDDEIVTAMLDGSHGEVDNLMIGMQSLGWDMTRIISAFEDAGAGKTDKVVSLLVLWGNSAEDVVLAAVNSSVSWSSITKGLQQGGQTTENTYNLLSNNGLDNRAIAAAMVAAGYDHAELVDVMKNQGMSFDDIISIFTNDKGKLIVDMSVFINAYKAVPA